MKRILASSLFALCLMVSMISPAGGQTLFDQGLKEYGQENYEEALTYFLEAYSADKGSARTAYYVGLTYKTMEKYKEAIPYFRDAATLTPRVDDDPRRFEWSTHFVTYSRNQSNIALYDYTREVYGLGVEYRF